MITIHDIAREAKTSIATVSRVMNDLPGCSEETRKRVLKIADDLGYETNAIAKSLVKKRTNTIGVIFPDISSQITNQLLNGIDSIANKRDTSIIVSYTYSNLDRTMKYLRTMTEKRVDGLIFSSDFFREEYHDYLKKNNIPYVLLSTKSTKYQLPYVMIDDHLAAYSATRYLIEKGHKNIGMISGPKADPIAGFPRINGYKQALKDYLGHESIPRIVSGESFEFKDGALVFQELYQKYPEITAIFAGGDELAVGAMNQAQKNGLSIPKDLSFVGFDNIILSEMIYPPLTTVSQPFYDMGSAATKMLFQLIDDNELLSSQVILPFEICERSSVRSL